VTAYDSAKSESTFSNEVGVLVPYAPPNVSFSASTSTGVAPLSVVFSNTTSGQVTTWAWDFGDGTSANIKAPTHIYSAPGNYVVALSATGPGGTARKIASTPIVVSAIPAPVANFVASRTSGVAPLAVTFANTSTGQVTTWGWSFGDGSITPFNAPWPRTATDALAWLDDGFSRYRTGVGRFSDDDLDGKPNMPEGWLDNEFPTAMNVQDITLELAHHGAEIALLRDLYRTRAGERQDTASAPSNVPM